MNLNSGGLAGLGRRVIQLRLSPREVWFLVGAFVGDSYVWLAVLAYLVCVAHRGYP